jgi:hypothetical protein
MPTSKEKISANVLFWLMLGALNLLSLAMLGSLAIDITPKFDWKTPAALIVCGVLFYFVIDLWISKRPQAIVNPAGSKKAISEEIAGIVMNVGGFALFQFVTNFIVLSKTDMSGFGVLGGGLVAYFIAYLIL